MMFDKKNRKFILNETEIELLEPLKIHLFTKTGMISSYHVKINDSEELLIEAHVSLNFVYHSYLGWSDSLRLNFTQINTLDEPLNKDRYNSYVKLIYEYYSDHYIK